MAKTPVITLDLNFRGRKQAIAAYLIPHSSGVVLVECGPGSTLPVLQAALGEGGYSPRDVTHLLLTHIHLDHAGAAGWFARQGTDVYVHPVGAPHMVDPEKLLASAARIYGDQMDVLWGEFLAVPEDKVTIAEDLQEIVIGNLHFLPVNTPGHAEHHYAYLFEDICFSGDIGGVRIPGFPYLRPPMPPPELHLERWRESLQRLRTFEFSRIAPTHFGIFDDPEWQLNETDKSLEAVSRWLDEVMPADPPIEELREKFSAWMDQQALAMGLSEQVNKVYELANPVGMSADGLLRYWRKYRTAN
jgi:glyoxylase-like metal-dependent hydrolase (beta-lactamase superfamily II)